jgi:hypothetical protein
MQLQRSTFVQPTCSVTSASSATRAAAPDTNHSRLVTGRCDDRWWYVVRRGNNWVIPEPETDGSHSSSPTLLHAAASRRARRRYSVTPAPEFPHIRQSWAADQPTVLCRRTGGFASAQSRRAAEATTHPPGTGQLESCAIRRAPNTAISTRTARRPTGARRPTSRLQPTREPTRSRPTRRAPRGHASRLPPRPQGSGQHRAPT